MLPMLVAQVADVHIPDKGQGEALLGMADRAGSGRAVGEPVPQALEDVLLGALRHDMALLEERHAAFAVFVPVESVFLVYVGGTLCHFSASRICNG